MLQCQLLVNEINRPKVLFSNAVYLQCNVLGYFPIGDKNNEVEEILSFRESFYRNASRPLDPLVRRVQSEPFPHLIGHTNALISIRISISCMRSSLTPTNGFLFLSTSTCLVSQYSI